MADFATAVATCERAVTGAAHDDKAQAWGRWTKYCASVGCNNPFMDKLSQQEQIFMLGSFAMAVRKGRFLGECFQVLAEGTVPGAISHVVQAFWAKGRPNPTKNVDPELSILLSRQFNAFRNKDPKQVQQQAIPFAVLDELAKRQVTDLDKAIVQLTTIAAFFACHSCKYLKILCKDMKRTNYCACKISGSLKTGIFIQCRWTVWNWLTA